MLVQNIRKQFLMIFVSVYRETENIWMNDNSHQISSLYQGRGQQFKYRSRINYNPKMYILEVLKRCWKPPQNYTLLKISHWRENFSSVPKNLYNGIFKTFKRLKDVITFFIYSVLGNETDDQERTTFIRIKEKHAMRKFFSNSINWNIWIEDSRKVKVVFTSLAGLELNGLRWTE